MSDFNNSYWNSSIPRDDTLNLVEMMETLNLNESKNRNRNEGKETCNIYHNPGHQANACCMARGVEVHGAFAMANDRRTAREHMEQNNNKANKYR